MFWVDPAAGTLAWDKPGKKSSKPNKGPFPLVSVLPDIPPERDARAWFKQADADGSGEIDADELAALYKKAREEKLSKARLKEAMAALDKDGNGTISFDEFQVRPQHHPRPAPCANRCRVPSGLVGGERRRPRDAPRPGADDRGRQDRAAGGGARQRHEERLGGRESDTFSILCSRCCRRR